jgi:hypothetical protein
VRRSCRGRCRRGERLRWRRRCTGRTESPVARQVLELLGHLHASRRLEGVSIPVARRAALPPAGLSEQPAGTRPMLDTGEHDIMRLPRADPRAGRRSRHLERERAAFHGAGAGLTDAGRRPARQTCRYCRRPVSQHRRRPDDRRPGRDGASAFHPHRVHRLPTRAGARAEREARRRAPGVDEVPLVAAPLHARRPKVLGELDHGPAWNVAQLPKPISRAENARHPQTVRPPSGPAGQDVSLELDAVHGPRAWDAAG